MTSTKADELARARRAQLGEDFEVDGVMYRKVRLRIDRRPSATKLCAVCPGAGPCGTSPASAVCTTNVPFMPGAIRVVAPVSMIPRLVLRDELI